MTTCETDGYRRLLNTLYNNLTQNTDVIESLKKTRQPHGRGTVRGRQGVHRGAWWIA